MTNIFKDSRRDLRERAFQTLFALEFGGEALDQAYFAYTYDKPIDEETEVDLPSFLLSLVTGVREELPQLDSQIEEKLKEGWSLSRLIMTDRTLLRLGLYEITSFEEHQDVWLSMKLLKLLKNILIKHLLSSLMVFLVSS